jgi:hypothetical protein
MSIAREVRQSRATRLVELKELRITFKQPDVEVDPVEATQVAKMVSIGRMRGMAITHVTVKRSELGG